MINIISIISPLAVLGVPAVLAVRYGAESRRGFDERRTDAQPSL
jgi:cytochrome c oxidase assembly factor CtaG